MTVKFTSTKFIFVILSIVLTHTLHAQEEKEETNRLLNLSLEELMTFKVTSVSKKEERLQESPNAIYVVTTDDIIQSGATNILEVLRLVPGFWGTQDEYGAGVYPNIRNSRSFENLNGTVLFMLDGTPVQDLIGSVFSYRNFDLPLDDIERIEVVKGSGGTIYGANSATGVVNIITKSPEDYGGIALRVDAATPGYTSTAIKAGGSLSDKVAIGGYAKHRYFAGFGDFAGLDENGNPLPQGSRFRSDYEESNMFSLGFKGNIKLSDRSKLSFKSHFNALSKTDYTNVFGPNNFDLITSSFVSDSLFENNINTHRLVANLQYDLTFSDRHALFARVSTNKEKEFNRQGGGYWTDNNIIDFEIQDNVQLGSINDLSIGANYRLVNYDIFEINDPTTINFTTLKDSESLTGAFVQNRVRLLGDQLNLIVGVKAENYSLINDTYYISPMAKVSYTPMENLTVWGGYSQSFTTPGLLNTNSEWFFFQQPERERWVEVVTLSVLDQAFRGAVEMGADDATALALAQGFVASPEGQATIQAGTDQQLAAAPNIAIRNSPNSEPTRFTNWELGLRYNMMGQIYFESNFFYSQIDDMVAIFVDPRVFTVQPSASQPGREALFLGYGNYYKGTSIGAESIIKYKPNSALEVEFSHTYLESDWSLQENEDFDIALISEEEQDRNPGTPFIPLHVFRVNFNYDIPDLFRVNVGVTRTSKFNTADDYSYEAERYGNPIDFPEPVSFATIAASDERTLVNLRIEKSFMSNRLDAYLFGNDVFNKGIVAGTFGSTSVSASRIGAMFGAGVNLKIN